VLEIGKERSGVATDDGGSGDGGLPSGAGATTDGEGAKEDASWWDKIGDLGWMRFSLFFSVPHALSGSGNRERAMLGKEIFLNQNSICN
jgi:hypothetical protein